MLCYVMLTLAVNNSTTFPIRPKGTTNYELLLRTGLDVRKFSFSQRVVQQ